MEAIFETAKPADLYAAIPNRFACRSYAPTPVEDVKSLEALLKTLSGVHPGVSLALADLRESPKAFTTPLFFSIIKHVEYSILISIEPGAARPAADVYAGYLGEIAVLYATSLGLNTVWVGAVSMMCKGSQIVEAAGAKADDHIAIVIPVGHAKDPKFVLHKKKELVKLFPDGAVPTDATLLEVAERIRACPTAMNKTPFTLSVTDSKIAITPNDPTKEIPAPDKMAAFCTQWLDCGIAAAHANVALREKWGKTPQLTITATQVVLE